MRDKVDH